MSSTEEKEAPSGQKIMKKGGVWTVNGRPRESIRLLSQVQPTSTPNKTVVTIEITFPPNSATPPHTHSGAFLTAIQHKGATLNQMGGDEPKISHVGDTFFEQPGCHHIRSENVSENNEEASVFVHMIVDTEMLENKGPGALLVLDADVEEQKSSDAGVNGKA